MTDDDDAQRRAVAARVWDAAAYFLSLMPDDMVAECQALAALNPDDAGLRLVHEPDEGLFAFLWLGRWLGSAPADWLLTGEEP